MVVNAVVVVLKVLAVDDNEKKEGGGKGGGGGGKSERVEREGEDRGEGAGGGKLKGVQDHNRETKPILGPEAIQTAACIFPCYDLPRCE